MTHVPISPSVTEPIIVVLRTRCGVKFVIENISCCDKILFQKLDYFPEKSFRFTSSNPINFEKLFVQEMTVKRRFFMMNSNDIAI